MARLTVQEKVEIIRIVGENTSFAEGTRIFNARHPDRPNVHVKTVAFINNLFNATGNIRKPRPKKYAVNNNVRHIHDEQIIQAFRMDPHASIRNVARNLNLDKSKVWRCLKRNRQKAFKPKFLHTLFEGDNVRRLEYCFWAQGNFLNDRNFLKNILYTDEATFTTNGVVSSQNCRYWAGENPHWIINCKNQKCEKVNVWCGILNEEIIGPFFFESLNAATFLNFLQTDFADVLYNMPLYTRSLLFQLDGAPGHGANM